MLSATLQPACFRDIYFGRVIVQSTGQPLGGSPGASARFTGTLTDLAWGADTEGITGVGALKSAAEITPLRSYSSSTSVTFPN